MRLALVGAPRRREVQVEVETGHRRRRRRGWRRLILPRRGYLGLLLLLLLAVVAVVAVMEPRWTRKPALSI